MQLQVKKISLSEFDQVEQQIIDNDQTFDQMYETWQSLDQFFRNASYETDAEFRLTYFRLYIRLTWKMLAAMDRDYFINIVRRQVLIFIISDIDVLNEIMWYLGFNHADKNALGSLYLELKQAFLESEAVVGKWKGNNVTVAGLVKEINEISKRKDSLEQAEFESKLKQIMFPNDPLVSKYFTADSDKAVQGFIDLVVFFDIINEKEIWRVVENFLNPEKYQGVVAGEVTPALENVSAATTPSKLVVPETIRPSVPQSSALAQTPIVEPQGRLTMGQIKSQIESQFKKDSDGNFVDIEGVMAKLNELAEKNNDPKIVEMYYYDETEDKFRWNV